MPMRINIGKSAPGKDELGRLPLFEGLEPDRRAGLAGMMGEESHHRGNVIFNQGDYGDVLYVIRSDSVRISQVSEDGHELILIVLRTGDFFGEMSLLDGESRSAAAIAAEDSTLLTLRRTDFMHFLGQNPSAAWTASSKKPFSTPPPFASPAVSSSCSPSTAVTSTAAVSSTSASPSPRSPRWSAPAASP